MGEESRENEKTWEAGEKSKRLLEDTYPSSAVALGAARPRLSASILHGAKDDGARTHVHDDH